MALWDAELFKRVEDRIMSVVSGKRQPIDVPYFRFLYDPALEMKCIEECENLDRRLRARGISSEIISLSELALAALKRLGCLEKDFIHQEQESREMIFEDLEREMPKLIVDDLRSHLKEKEISHCVILIRAGALFPFVHISTMLTALEGSVRCTLLVPYPGNREGEMLNYRGETIKSYYRGEVIE